MTKTEARKEAKTSALYFAIEGLKNRLDGDIVDEVEQAAYQAEIDKLIKQLQKVGA